MKKKKTWKIIKQKGLFIKKEILKLSKKHDLDLSITGLDALPKIEFKKNVNNDYCNFICYEMLKNKFLFKNTVYLYIAHNDKVIQKFLNILDKIFFKIKNNELIKFKSLSDFKRYN